MITGPLCVTIDGMKELPVGNRVMDNAYLWDRNTIHTGEALLLACLLHSKGQSRASKDMTDVQKIMRDKNLEINRKR